MSKTMTIKDSHRRTHRRSAFIFLFVMSILFNWTASYFELLKFLEYRSYDTFLKMRNLIRAPSIPDNIVIVAIDEPSMQKFNLQWPWTRRLHGDLVTAMHEAGAAIVAFDVIFSEPENDESDLYFANAMERSANVVLAEGRDTIKERMYQLSVSVLPLPELKMSAIATGLVWMPLDDDGFIRRVNYTQADVPPFAFVVAEEYRKNKGDKVDSLDPVSTFNMPHDITDPLIINYLGVPRSINTVSYYQALDYRKWLTEDFFRDKIVMVGSSMAAPPDLKTPDHFTYPFLSTANSQISGVEVHASLVDTLLRQRYLKPVSFTGQWLMFVFFLTAGAILLWRFSHWKAGINYIVLMGIFLFSQFMLFYIGNYITNVVAPLSCLLLFLISERVYNYAIIDREKRFIRKAFGHYVSPVIVNQLIERPEQLNLSGEYYETTILFSDLIGFTSLSERMEPMKLQALLEEYFTKMVEPILAMNGTLDKFIGDAVMCFFGVPIHTPEHARQGVIAAWNMQLQLQRLNAQWVDRNLPTLGMRIGINSGRVIAGNMGAINVFNYTVMGDPVNLAARLESANKQYGTSIMLGENTYTLTKGEFETRRLDIIRVKGKEQAISIYQLLGPPGTVQGEKAEQMELYELAFTDYLQQEFHSSIKLLDQILRLGPDKPSELIRERCAIYLQSPPGDDWDGVYTMTTK